MKIYYDKLYNNSKKGIYDIREFWGLAKNIFFELGTTALALLNVHPTEACVERSFSIQSYIHTKLRNRLSADSVEMEMFLNINKENSNLNLLL